mgnify:CR=1 FL=1
MLIVLTWLVMVVFAFATAMLAVFGLHLYVLLFLFRRHGKTVRATQKSIVAEYLANTPESAWPLVTTQLPIYNESDVAERVMEAVAAMDYPLGRHEVQVLDDSTDHTRGVVDRAATRLAKRGVNVQVIRRSDRVGYKAGALAEGLKSACGKYVAIFDADFVPPADFLRRAVALLDGDDSLACMQGRWTHLNRHESWLTEAQALGIDGHFAIEQGARAWNGLMMNFNGTAGMWRKRALEDREVGGWSADTLTEDLDLSYRAQLCGWKIGYCFDLACPAELPNTLAALKSQQRRWATGSIQTARKLLPRIWRGKISLGEKLEATLHLTHYSVAFWMLLLAVAALPLSRIVGVWPGGPGWLRYGWFAVLLSTIAPSLVYSYARYLTGGRWSGFRTIPSMLVLGCGICVNNSLAFLQGLFVRGGEFVRTPKSGSTQKSARSSTYLVPAGKLWIAETSLGLYTLLTACLYLCNVHSGISVFIFIYAAGFLCVGWFSRPRRTRVRRVNEVPAAYLSPMDRLEAEGALGEVVGAVARSKS